MPSTEEPRRGLVYTFYSFKGGVGRSMALANVAALLARWGQRVLVVDWDLEAPGLEKFFQRWLSGSRKEIPGLVDLFHGYDGSPSLNWQACLLQVTLPQAQRIHLISAGRVDTDYGARLNALNWEMLFKERRLGAYLERLRQEWIAEYDFVLVDSRTGITDIGGICTIHLPDVLVCFFTTTEQSLEGVQDVMQRARRGHGSLPVDRSRLLIVPIPARDESRTEYRSSLEWRQRAAAELEPFYSDWIPKEDETLAVLDLLKIPYVAYWSFGERLPVLEEDPDNPDKLAFYYQLLARLMLGQLDLKEVKQGRQAAQALEEQRLETERRANEAALAREKAEREAAERERAQHQLVEAELRDRVDKYLVERWSPAIRRLEETQRMYWQAGLMVALASLIVYATSFPFRDWWLRIFGLTESGLQVALPLACACGLLAGYGLLLLGRRNGRVADDLRRELALFEGLAGPYTQESPLRAASRFMEVSEEIIMGGRYRASPGNGDSRSTASQSAASTPVWPGQGSPSTERADRELHDIAIEPASFPRGPSPTEALTGHSDVYVSYHRDRVTTEWLREFMPLFLSWLSELLGHEPSVFFDEASQIPGSDWSAGMAAARDGSTCLLAIVGPTYFTSTWAAKDWEAFARSRTDKIVPVLLKGTLDQLPEEARRLQLADFRDYAFIGAGFRKTERYVDFQLEVRKLAERVAAVIRSAPVMPTEGLAGTASANSVPGPQTRPA